MKKSNNLVKLSDSSYQNAVDDGLNTQQTNLNKVMKFLTMVTVAFIPFTVLSGFGGMNVRIPF